MFFEGQRVEVQLSTKLSRAERILKTPLALTVSGLPVSLGFQNDDSRRDDNQTTPPPRFLWHLSSQGHKYFLPWLAYFLHKQPKAEINVLFLHRLREKVLELLPSGASLVQIKNNIVWFFLNRIMPLFIYLFIYLFMSALHLRCYTWDFSSCGEQGLLIVVVHRL